MEQAVADGATIGKGSRPLMRRIRPQWPVLLLFLFITIVLGIKTYYNVYDDLIFSYPFISYDGFEWIAEGAHYLNPDLDIRHRNPGLPLIFALLKAWDAERLYPIVQSALLFVFLIYLYLLLNRFVDRRYATFTVLTFFCIFKLHSLFDFVLADGWALTLLVMSIHHLIGARERPAELVLAAALTALSLNFQFAIGFLCLAYLYYLVAAFDRSYYVRNRYWVAASLAVLGLIALPQFLYVLLLHGSPISPDKNDLQYVGLHGFGLFYYLVNYFAWFNVPIGLMILVGFLRSLRDRSPEMRFVHLCVLSYFVFWILLYLWLDQRFLAYFVPFLAIYFARSARTLVPLLSRRSVPASVALGSSAAVVFLYGVLMASQTVPLFSFELLPVAPGTVARFHKEPITWIGGNQIITLEEPPKLEHLPGWNRSFRSFYRHHKKRDLGGTFQLRNELLEIRSIVHQRSGPSATIQLCGVGREESSLYQRVFDTLRRNLDLRCLNRPGLALRKRTDAALPAGARSLFTGERLELYVRDQPRR